MDQAAHANLEAVLWRDTAFLAGLGVMDYSLLVGLDSHSHRLVIGIIDFIRQVCPVRLQSSSGEVAQHMTALCLAHASSIWLLLCAALLLAPSKDNCKQAASVRGIILVSCSILGTSSLRPGSNRLSCWEEHARNQQSFHQSSIAGASEWPFHHTLFLCLPQSRLCPAWILMP